MNAVVAEPPHLRAVLSPEQVTPAAMISLALQHGIDLQQLEKLMELHERWEANQARKSFEVAMAAAKAEIRPIIKNREVDFTSQKGRTNYEYEDFAAVADQVDPILAKHGLNYRHRPKQDGKSLTIICKIAHRDGHFEEIELTADKDESGNKNSIQAVGSTATYLQRYTVKLALGLAAAKDDDGRSASKNAEPERPKAPEGYETWSDDLNAVVEEGRDRLLEVWKVSPMPLRAYMAKHEAPRWEGMKKRAEALSKGAVQS